MSGRIKKIVFKPKQDEEKKRICIRFPKDIKSKLKQRSDSDYQGRGKQSRFVEDAIKYYLFCTESINWQDYERDSDYAELIDDINEGLNQSNLAGATQVFISSEAIEQLTKLETRIILSKPTLRDARTGLIRKAVSIRLSIDSKQFFDEIMGKGVNK